MKLVDYSYWNYFLSLEKDLQVIGRYIELSDNNFDTYSVEILKLFLASSSEFEVVMKEIGMKYEFSDISEAKSDKNINIETLRNLIDNTSQLQMVKNIEITFKHFNIYFSPIQEIWNKESWWKDYNAVKHNRSLNYSKANLGNVLKSMGSLFLANIFLYEKEFHNNNIQFEENISIVLSNLQGTNLFELKDKKYYSYRYQAFFS